MSPATLIGATDCVINPTNTSTKLVISGERKSSNLFLELSNLPNGSHRAGPAGFYNFLRVQIVNASFCWSFRNHALGHARILYKFLQVQALFGAG
jgi:hypothetical protein